MRINKFFKYLMIIFLSFICVLLVGCGDVDAVLQSNGNDPVAYNVNDWAKNVRKMESLGGAMGLSETIASDLMPTTPSNNIDVHMQKNTEYGAMAILSASAYGNPNKIASGDTTTGNSTGIVMKINSEWVAVTTYDGHALKNMANRYKNIYNYQYVPKPGDAITETKKWHGNGNSAWLSNNSSSLARADSGSIYSYYGWCDHYYNGPGSYATLHFSRAVVVVGEDL